MHAVLFDEEVARKELLPLTFTRPVAALRFGILTMAMKWEHALGKPCGYHTEPYLAAKFPASSYPDPVYINACFCPDPQLISAITALRSNEVLFAGGQMVACFGDPRSQDGKIRKDYNGTPLAITAVTDLFTKNDAALKADFQVLTRGRKSEKLSGTVTVIGDSSLVFLEKGARAEACIFNTTTGPIYLDADAEVMEGCAVRGPFSLGEHSTLKMNAKIYGATTIGPHCKVGGEVSNSVIFGYSNKAHDGFLGNSVLGEWCNLGADTNNSNLKNNYGNVKLFNYRLNAPADTGLQFCGLIMGDHSKSGINTMFNTGTVVGVGANIFGGGFPPTHVPSFTWGGGEKMEEYRLDKMFETSARVFGRRSMAFSQAEKDILTEVHRQSRSWQG